MRTRSLSSLVPDRNEMRMLHTLACWQPVCATCVYHRTIHKDAKVPLSSGWGKNVPIFAARMKDARAAAFTILMNSIDPLRVLTATIPRVGSTSFVLCELAHVLLVSQLCGPMPASDMVSLAFICLAWWSRDSGF